MAHATSLKEVSKSPDVEAGSDLNYSRLAFVSTSMATFIRELGYKAIPAVNEMALNIPLAIDAGLGELGRNGLLITPEYGPAVQICKVFTNLPLDFDSPIDFGIQKFCEKCKLCAKYCSAKALSNGERMNKGWDKSNSPGLSKWPIKAMDCFDFWVNNGNHCSVCMRVCPFTRFNPLYHSIVNIFSCTEIFTKMLVYLHEFLGIGKKEENSKKYLSNFIEPKKVKK
jgi:reductive dehalogenase